MKAQQIIDYVCHEYHTTKTELQGSGRQANVVLGRHICFYMMSTLSGLSTVQIGRYFNRDHSSVWHGCKKIKAMIEAGKLDLDIEEDKAYEPKMEHQVKLDQILTDGLGMVATEINKAFAVAPMETTIELIRLAKRLKETIVGMN